MSARYVLAVFVFWRVLFRLAAGRHCSFMSILMHCKERRQFTCGFKVKTEDYVTGFYRVVAAGEGWEWPHAITEITQ